MAVYKRYKGKKLAPNSPDWDKGTWVVEFHLRGQYVKQSLPEARGVKQAEQAEIQIKQSIFDKKYNKAGSVTLFSDFVDNVYMPWSEDNKKSWKDDFQRSNRLKLFFKQTPLRDVSPMQVEKFKSKLRKEKNKKGEPLGPATVNRYLAVLSGIFTKAGDNTLIEVNPVSKVDKLQEPDPRDRFLNMHADDEEDRLFDHLSGYGEHVLAIADLDLETGLRLGELLKVRWLEIDFTQKTLTAKNTKNGKVRIMPLTAKAVRILKALRQDAPDTERVFDHKRTGRKRRQMMVCFEQAVDEAGLPDFHFHDLRRTFATRLRSANVHEYDIAELLGHSVPKGAGRETKVTMGYARGVPQRLRDAVNLLEKGKLLTFGTPSPLHLEAV